MDTKRLEEIKERVGKRFARSDDIRYMISVIEELQKELIEAKKFTDSLVNKDFYDRQEKRISELEAELAREKAELKLKDNYWQGREDQFRVSEAKIRELENEYLKMTANAERERLDKESLQAENARLRATLETIAEEKPCDGRCCHKYSADIAREALSSQPEEHPDLLK